MSKHIRLPITREVTIADFQNSIQYLARKQSELPVNAFRRLLRSHAKTMIRQSDSVETLGGQRFSYA